jgi:hypothetical protein
MAFVSLKTDNSLVLTVIKHAKLCLNICKEPNDIYNSVSINNGVGWD